MVVSMLLVPLLGPMLLNLIGRVWDTWQPWSARSLLRSAGMKPVAEFLTSKRCEIVSSSQLYLPSLRITRWSSQALYIEGESLRIRGPLGILNSLFPMIGGQNEGKFDIDFQFRIDSVDFVILFVKHIKYMIILIINKIKNFPNLSMWCGIFVFEWFRSMSNNYLHRQILRKGHQLQTSKPTKALQLQSLLHMR